MHARSASGDQRLAQGAPDGARLLSATENIDESPSGRLMHGIMATIAEFYSQNLGAEAKKGMTQKAKLGGTPGLAPIGYRNARLDVDGREVRTVTVDEDRAQHVRWAFEQFATGEHTVSSLTEALENRGLECRATPKLPARPLSRARVHKMLRNPYYVGVIVWNGAEYSGRHEPLVSRLTWDAVQGVLDTRSLGKERPMKRVHYLKGLLRCGHCRSRLGISLNRGKNGQRYPYYFCLGRQRGNGCDLPYLSIERVEVAVERKLAEVVIPAELISKIRGEVARLIEATTKDGRLEQERQGRRLEKLEREEVKLLQAHYADAVSLAVLQKEQARIASERTVANMRLQSVISESETLQESLESALAQLDRCDEFYSDGGPSTRRELLFGLYECIYIDSECTAEVELNEPFAQLLDPHLSERVEQEIEELVSDSVDDQADAIYDDRGREAKNSALRCRGRSSNENILVDVHSP